MKSASIHPAAFCGGLFVFVVLLCSGSLCAGKVWIPLHQWLATPGDPSWAILVELRLPRTILAVMVGAVLGLGGATMQGYTRNPLADPGMLGVSSMAALGAVTTFYMGSFGGQPWVLPMMAMAGSALGVALLLALAGSTSSMVLADDVPSKVLASHFLEKAYGIRTALLKGNDGYVLETLARA